MPSTVKDWLTPGTITSLISTVFVIGTFVGVTNYRASRQDDDWKEFRKGITEQLAEYKRGTDAKIDKIESRIDEMSRGNLENIKLQARFDALEKELSRINQENRDLNGKVQAQWDSLTTRLARVERGQ